MNLIQLESVDAVEISESESLRMPEVLRAAERCAYGIALVDVDLSLRQHGFKAEVKLVVEPSKGELDLALVVTDTRSGCAIASVLPRTDYMSPVLPEAASITIRRIVNEMQGSASRSQH